jgi:hypothetical protein
VPLPLILRGSFSKTVIHFLKLVYFLLKSVDLMIRSSSLFVEILALLIQSFSFLFHYLQPASSFIDCPSHRFLFVQTVSMAFFCLLQHRFQMGYHLPITAKCTMGRLVFASSSQSSHFFAQAANLVSEILHLFL